MKKRSISVVMVLGIMINLLIPFNVSASMGIPDYSIWKADFLMAQLTDTVAADIATRDIYDAVAKESYYYRDIYNQCVDSKLYNFVQVETAQWCVDGVDFVTKPEFFYDIVLIDILQNKAIETVASKDYQAELSSLMYSITCEVANNWNEDIRYDELLDLHFSSDEMISEAKEKWRNALTKYNDNKFNLEFIDYVCSIGESYSDALTEILSLLEAAKYSEQQVTVLKTMYERSENEYLKTALSKQIEVWENFSDPTYIYTSTDFAFDVGTATIENLHMFIVENACKVGLESVALFNPIIGVISATWEIGTSVANLVFNTEDSATAYLTIKATVEIENVLQTAMQELRNIYNNDKSLYNAELCLEAYKMTLANAYNGTNVAQEFGYAITNGDKNYEYFVSIGDSCREIIKIRYYEYPRVILKFYGLIFYHTDDLSVLSSISSEDIQDGSETIYNGVHIWNINGDYTLESNDVIIVDSINLNNGTLSLNDDSILIVRENIIHNKGNINVGTGNIYIGGNYNHSGGLLNVGNGFIEIGGNYRAENNFQDGDCNLVMQDKDGYMLVNGDFYVAIDRDSNGLLTAGTLELKGDFTQRGDRRGWSYYTDTRTVYGFCPTGEHRVIFSGDEPQYVTRQTWQTYTGEEQLNYPVCSYFNIVKSTNPDVIFQKDFFVKNIEKGSVFETLRLKNVSLSNTDFSVNGNFYSTNVTADNSVITVQILNILGETDFNDSELRVLGNVEHSGGALKLGTSRLLVEGNYNHKGGELIAENGYIEIKGNYTATGSCNLVMQDGDGYVLIDGNYYVEKDNDSVGYLTAGTLELKGNFSQYGGKRGMGYLGNPASAYGFCSTDKHIIVLSGNEKQTIYTQSTGLFGSLYKYPACSYFNVLKIENTSADGIAFTSTVYVLSDIKQPTGTSITNRNNVYLDNQSAFVDYGTLNVKINAYVGNDEKAVPTYKDYNTYKANTNNEDDFGSTEEPDDTENSESTEDQAITISDTPISDEILGTKRWDVCVGGDFVVAGDVLMATLTNTAAEAGNQTQEVTLIVGDNIVGEADWAFCLNVKFFDFTNAATTSLAIAKMVN